MENENNLCPCCSGKTYDTCCKPFHEGIMPKTALDLMRSRYCAYVLNLADYIVATTHPANPEYLDNKFSWKRSISLFSKNSSFKKLVILDFKETDSIATVTFTAYLSQKDHDATFTEKSFFEKIKDKWLYRGAKLADGHEPNLVTVGQLRILPFAYYGDPVLRKKADPILNITPEIKKLVEQMVETMDASDGLGLAAPQVHHSIQLFVIRTPTEDEEKNLELGAVKVFINPTVSLSSKETWITQEGCLSIPSLRSDVERPEEITVEYTTLEGEIIKNRFYGWEARVILHEYDHLQGIFFTDRLDPKEQKKLAPWLKKLAERIHDHKAL